MRHEIYIFSSILKDAYLFSFFLLFFYYHLFLLHTLQNYFPNVTHQKKFFFSKKLNINKALVRALIFLLQLHKIFKYRSDYVLFCFIFMDNCAPRFVAIIIFTNLNRIGERKEKKSDDYQIDEIN